MNTIRIIGGAWKRTPLVVAAVPGLRPTPDRVRETLFNWLGQRLDGFSCLDLFAGSGALGLEALSRGAREVLFVESDRRALRAIEQTLGRLGEEQVRGRAELWSADALSALGRCARLGRRYDLVFLDPPYKAGLLERVWPLLGSVLPAEALIYVECGAALADADLAAIAVQLGGGRALQMQKRDRAGQVHYHLLVSTVGASEA